MTMADGVNQSHSLVEDDDLPDMSHNINPPANPRDAGTLLMLSARTCEPWRRMAQRRTGCVIGSRARRHPNELSNTSERVSKRPERQIEKYAPQKAGEERTTPDAKADESGALRDHESGLGTGRRSVRIPRWEAAGKELTTRRRQAP